MTGTTKTLVVKKDNALVNAAYTLNLAEQRMVLLASALANTKGDPLNGLTLRADQYADVYKVSNSAGYKALKEACETLFERRVTFHRGNTKTVTRWVSFVTYREGTGEVEIGFSPKVIPLFEELQNKYTFYALDQVASLTSIHAVRLYQLLISWRSTLKTPVFELEKFRLHIGIEPDEYPRMTNFKQRVLDVAVKQVNEHTDIIAEYEQIKKGRKITGFRFTFKFKNPTRDPNTIDMFSGSTDAEIGKKPKRKKITQAQAESMAKPGESWQDLLLRIGGEYHVIKD